MGHQSILFTTMSLLLIWQVLNKWNKSLLIIISLETLTAIMLSWALYTKGMDLKMVMLMLPFFVSEALILLTALLKALRTSGSPSSMVTIY